MNPIFSLIAQTSSSGPSIYETLELIIAGLIAVYGLNKIGDIKMIIYVLAVGVGVIGLFYVIPPLHSSPAFPYVEAFVMWLSNKAELLIPKLGDLIS